MNNGTVITKKVQLRKVLSILKEKRDMHGIKALKYVMKIIKFILIISLCIQLLLSGCTPILKEDSREKATMLQDIAYDGNTSFENTIYIKENNTYVPYLVLTDNYDGRCLLLRQYLLDEPYIYNTTDKETSSYYENSEIDIFLNKQFFHSLDKEIQENVVEQHIEITSEDSLGNKQKGTVFIDRNVFLLSMTELGYFERRIILKEGEPLEYFKTVESRIAPTNNMSIEFWWTRTPNSYTTNEVAVIDFGGGFGGSGIYGGGKLYEHGVRPAFCMPCETEIKQIEWSGMQIFTVS